MPAELHRFHGSCRNEHLVPREDLTDLWDWELGGAKVRASSSKEMLQMGKAELNTATAILRGEVEAGQLLQGQGKVSTKISFLFTDD